MRFAFSFAVLAIVATASASAQVQEQSQEELFSEGLTACAAVFAERNPSAPPPSFPPSSSPFIDNGYGKERAIAYNLKPLPVEDLRRAGWEMSAQSRFMDFTKRSAGRAATLTSMDMMCSISMFAKAPGSLDAGSLLATTTSFVAGAYPAAVLVGDVEKLEPQSGKSTVTRTRWQASDGMHVALSISRADGESRVSSVSAIFHFPRFSRP